MTHAPFRDVDAWLRAEAEGRDADADLLFAAAFRASVPRLTSPPGLTGRIMGALAWQQMADRIALPMPLWARTATVALLVLGGLAAAGLWSISLFDVLHAAWPLGPRAARGAAALAASLLQAFAQTVSQAASVSHALALAFGSGPGAALLAANLFLAVGASAVLKHILSPEENRS